MELGCNFPTNVDWIETASRIAPTAARSCRISTMESATGCTPDTNLVNCDTKICVLTVLTFKGMERPGESKLEELYQKHPISYKPRVWPAPQQIWFAISHGIGVDGTNMFP